MAKIDAAAKEVSSKYEKIMDGVGVWTSFYRCNPHRLLVDYFNMSWLKPFQKMLIMLMFRFTYFMLIASRGMGKSQLVAAFCVAWCTLFPGTKIVIAAGKRGQSINVLNKIIEDFLPKSQNLRNELQDWSTSHYDAHVTWKNGSTIKVVTAADSARSNRANIIIFDEFRMIKKDIIDKVLRKFKAGQRSPDFYLKPEYKKHPKEPNKEIYLSSAYYKHHWSWAKFKAFFNSSFYKLENYFVCGFPYQLPVGGDWHSEGYLPLEQVLEEMQEDDWDSVTHSMELESLFFGGSEHALYSFEDADRSRKIQVPIYPKYFYPLLNDSRFKYVEKKDGEIRLLSIDVAYIPSKKNDASAFTVMCLVPSRESNQYFRDVVYMETRDGGNFADQALQARRLFSDFDCDYIIVDTNGVGAGLYDELIQEKIDAERGITYPAWTCKNDDKMASLCSDQQAPSLIYSIKANAEFNSTSANSLRDGLKRGKIRLLINESDGNDILYKVKAFSNMTVEDQIMFQAPYYQTTSLINEMVNLDYEIVNGKTKVMEKAGMRKDRYSSILYAYAIANELERDFRSMSSEYDYQTLVN